MIRGGGELITQLVTGGKSVSPYVSSLDGKTEVMKSVKGVVSDVKELWPENSIELESAKGMIAWFKERTDKFIEIPIDKNDINGM